MFYLDIHGDKYTQLPATVSGDVCSRLQTWLRPFLVNQLLTGTVECRPPMFEVNVLRKYLDLSMLFTLGTTAITAIGALTVIIATAISVFTVIIVISDKAAISAITAIVPMQSHKK